VEAASINDDAAQGGGSWQRRDQLIATASPCAVQQQQADCRLGCRRQRAASDLHKQPWQICLAAKFHQTMDLCRHM
jgi:hypothetical protein